MFFCRYITNGTLFPSCVPTTLAPFTGADPGRVELLSFVSEPVSPFSWEPAMYHPFSLLSLYFRVHEVSSAVVVTRQLGLARDQTCEMSPWSCSV